VKQVTAFVLLAAALAACSVGSGPSGSASPRRSADAVELTVFGAASLLGVLEEARTAYEAAAPGTTIVLSTDSSSALRTQIEQGAPADVFLSADTANPEALVTAGLTDGPGVDFAGNALTVITPADDPGGIDGPDDLATSGVKIIAAGEEVPITKYATQAVDNLAALPGYPPGFAAAYAANIVSREDNVRQVVAKIELGEGDAAIVYVSDAKTSTRVDAIDIPDEANVPATYAAVVVKASPRLVEARSFLDWFVGEDGLAILVAFGFLPPG
jgi:molybdate transport system substrate-binding protein